MYKKLINFNVMKINILKLTLIGILLVFIELWITAQETYKENGTTYYEGKSYTTTGKPLVKRSESTKKQFLKSKGYDKEPSGYQVDHIKPLSEGGTDTPDNMQLITIKEHQLKTARERQANSVYKATSTRKNTADYYSTPTTTKKSNKNDYYSAPTSTQKTQTNNTYSAPTNQSSERVLQTGSRGGQYYINSNGNKTYVKKR